MKLNLASGDKLRDGYVSVDQFHPGADMRVDLEAFPWPWESGSVDAVYMSHYLEHTIDPRRTIAEVWRILKPNGMLEIEVPHKDGLLGCMPDHLHVFGIIYMRELGFAHDNWWEGGLRSGHVRFVCDQLTYIFRDSAMWHPFMRRVLWPIFRGVANLNPNVQLLWEFLGLPTDAICWVGRKSDTASTGGGQ